MAQVIAVTQIHRTVEPGKKKTATEPAVAPKTKVIMPGTTFVSEGTELESLLRHGAVRYPESTSQTREAKRNLAEVADVSAGDGNGNGVDENPGLGDKPVKATSRTGGKRGPKTSAGSDLI